MLEYLLPRASSFAASIDHLFDLITYLVMFWFVLVLGFFFYVVFRFRARKGVKAQYITGETHKEKMAVEVPHYLILVCDVAILVYTFLVWHEVKIDMPEPDEKVRVIAQQWAWTFQHAGPDGVLGNAEGTDAAAVDDVFLVNEMVLKKDVQYTFELSSRDVMHSFSIPVFRLKQDAVPGRIIQGHFKPILEGEWDIQCAEMCGYGHGFMPARMKILGAEAHADWLAQNAPADALPAAAMANAQPLTEEDANNG